MNEVYAHAVLGKHQHVVRYYSAWAENDHMYIQNEFCNGKCVKMLKFISTWYRLRRSLVISFGFVPQL